MALTLSKSWLIAAAGCVLSACVTTGNGTGKTAAADPAKTPDLAAKSAAAPAPEAATPGAAAAPSTGPKPQAALVESAGDDCIFGHSISEIEEAPEFKAQESDEQKLVPRGGTHDPHARTFNVTQYRHMPTGTMFTVYSTFRKEDDGGNTLGWIERTSDSKIVAEIEGSDIVSCQVTLVIPRVMGGPTDTCLFGMKVDTLDDPKLFSAAPMPDVKSQSKREGDEPQDYHFHVIALRHAASGKTYNVYRTYLDKEDGGDHIGWIESDTGEVVAEIGDESIYGCGVTAAGVVVRSATKGAECKFGTDVHDLEISEDFSMTAKGQVKRASRITGDDQPSRTYAESELKDNKSGKVFKLFETFRDEDDGGHTLGWIEAGGTGEVVAEIGNGEFYNCR